MHDSSSRRGEFYSRVQFHGGENFLAVVLSIFIFSVFFFFALRAESLTSSIMIPLSNRRSELNVLVLFAI